MIGLTKLKINMALTKELSIETIEGILKSFKKAFHSFEWRKTLVPGWLYLNFGIDIKEMG